MTKARVRQKNVLRLDLSIPTPNHLSSGDDAVIDVLKKLSKEKSLEIGINSVNRLMIQKKAAILVIASGINPPELVFHLLAMARSQNLPTIFLKSQPRSIGEALGRRTAAALAVKASSPRPLVDVLLPFACQVPQQTDLLPLAVENDLYVPSSQKPRAKSPPGSVEPHKV